tara:strand:+ start:16244 stop:17572 length:1329 start_codon:yes stop_codon:yes gene_type:complete
MSYVYYTPSNGRINKVSNRRQTQESYDILEVPHEMVKEILEGSKKTEDFIVDYDVSIKQLVLKEINYESELTSVSNLLHLLPITYSNTNININTDQTPVILKEIYDGVEVFVWLPGETYFANSLVWHNKTVYKLITDTTVLDFKKANSKVYIKDVVISNWEISLSTISLGRVHERAYDGIFVDVWYDELSHMSGQHIWYNNAVYKIIKDQSANTEFTISNAELIVDNVKLHNDSNQNLKFNEVFIGDLYLDNNLLYIYCVKSVSDELAQKFGIVFFTSEYEAILYDIKTKRLLKWYKDKKGDQVEFIYETIPNSKLNLTQLKSLKRGQKILLGKKIVQLSDIDSDIVVIENQIDKYWSIRLSNAMKEFLKSSSYRKNDKLYFSITSKYDPNILYRTLDFSLNDLLNNNYKVYDFKYDCEFTGDEVSIYTTKFFDSYAHEVIK